MTYCSTGPCPNYPNAKCVVYTGSNLLCSGIKTNDRLDVILAKIDAILCAGGSGTGVISIIAGLGIDIDGVGTIGNPIVVSSTLTANSGLILSGTVFKLGQTVGAASNPAALLVNTEIPMGDFSLVLNNKTGTGGDTAFITFSTTNSPGYSYSGIAIASAFLSQIPMSVESITGNMEISYTVLNGQYQGASGYNVDDNYFYLADMRGTTTATTVQIGGTNSQTWDINGDTYLGLFGTNNTNFGSSDVPTAFIDIAASTTTKGSERTRAGVTPSSGYLDGIRWYDGTHYYMRIGGVDKQLDNDYNFTPDDFIQNQFVGPQPIANYWIDGHARIDDYLQIEDAARLVKDSGGTLSVTTDTSSTIGDNLRVRKLTFFADNLPTVLGSSEVYEEAGGALTLQSTVATYMRTPVVSFKQDTIMDVGGFHPLTFVGSQGFAGEYSIIELVNENTAGLPNSERSEITFSNLRTTGGKTRFASVGSDVIDFSNTLYKGDLVFRTVDATVNIGAPTEYFRIKYDGRLIAESLDTDNTPFSTTGTVKDVVCDATGLLTFRDFPISGSPDVPISILTPALSTNAINNLNYAQAWSWDSLVSGAALELGANTTAANGGTLTVLDVNTTGVNANAAETTRAASFANTHSGTTSSNIGIEVTVGDGESTNIGIFLNVDGDNASSFNQGIQSSVAGDNSTNTSVNALASGGGTADNTALRLYAAGGLVNTAMYIQAGDVTIDSFTNLSDINVVVGMNGLNKLGYLTAGTGITISGGTISASTAGLQGIDSVLNTDNQLTTARSIDADGNNFSIENIDDFTVDATGTSFFKVDAFGGKSVGDVWTLRNTTTGEVGWEAPGAGSSGTVTSFSAGDLTDFFTTSEATVTTTPALSFAFVNAPATSYWGNDNGGASAPAYITAGALTRVNDTNVILTLGGSPTTSLLDSVSLTLSWSGELAIARGGTGLSALGSASQLIRVNAGATALEYFTPTYISTAVQTLNTLTASTQTFAVGSAGSDFNISSITATHTFNIPSASLTARGLVTITSQSFEGIKTFNVGAVFNESGADSDFRIESDGNANAFFIDASTDRIGIFTNAPSYPLHVVGNMGISSGTLGIGTAPTTTAALTIGGTAFTLNGMIISSSVSASAGSSPSLCSIAGTIIEAGSGTHTIISALSIPSFTITSGLAVVTDATSFYIAAAPTCTTTSGTTYAILVGSGTCRFNGDLVTGSATSYTSGGYTALVRNNTSGRFEVVDTGLVNINPQPGTAYTLQLSDKDSMVNMTNALASTVTIPTNASVAFPIGTQILVKAKGAGQVTIAGAGTVTVEAADNALKTRVQYVIVTLIKEDTNTWGVTGDLVV